MKNRSVLNSPRLLELKRKKRRKLINKLLLLILFLFLVLVGLSFLSKWEKINIHEIQISGNKIIDTNNIEEVVREDISGRYLWFFPKTNFLLYPKKEIEKELALKFNRIKNISLNLKNLNVLEVSLTERNPLYTYCGPTLLSEIQKKCYFLDEDGYIFDEALYFSGEVFLKFYGTIEHPVSETNPSGSYFYQSDFKNLISLKETLEKIGIKPVIFYIEDGGDVRMFLSSLSKSETGPEIIFKLDSDFDKIVENLQSVLTTEPLQSDFKNKYSSLLYIDLRFGNKVYYKFK